MAATKKTGRKKKHHVTTYSDETINGLSRRPSDGRWRIIGTQITFTEPDERLAIAKFLQLTGAEPASEALLMMTTTPDRYGGTAARHIRGLLRNTAKEGEPDPITLVDPIIFWARVRREILERPKWVAEQTGIEQIGYFVDLKPPEPLPTFEKLEDVWRNHCDASDEQRRKVLHDFRDFVKISGIESLRDINPQIVIAYRDVVYERGMSSISERNLFSRIRRLVSFAKSRAIAMECCSTALQCLALLVPRGTVISLDPRPIEVEEYRALLETTEGADKAMILLMLNCAMYLAEAVRLKWADIKDGCVITHRAKTGSCVRVAVLWPETLDALKCVKQKGDYIFNAYTGNPLGIKGAEKRFRDLREMAEVEVTSSQLRDGAYTAAVEANVTEGLCRLLVGHRSGISDHYVKRKPSMVAPACEAVRQKYIVRSQIRTDNSATQIRIAPTQVA